ncbi:hypothetical protein ACHAWF_007592 [Thalassiosira exigua]
MLDKHITWAEDERTTLAKGDVDAPARRAINAAHGTKSTTKTPLLQRTKNLGQAFSASLRRTERAIFSTKPTVSFAANAKICTYDSEAEPIFATYDSGADGHYISKRDRCKANLPILRPSTKRVGVANGGVSKGRHRTSLPFPKLSPQANEADSFVDFPHSLLSVGKVADDGGVSIFTKDGVSVYKEEDVLITCKGDPLFVGVRDERGRFRFPLVQRKGQWRPRAPTKRVRAALERADSVYDLPSVEQAVRWMHAVCGYPVKSTWLKAVKAGNFQGWPVLNERNVNKYYPDTAETQKGHMNQTRKNVRSTKPKQHAFEEVKDGRLRGQKVRDVYTAFYDVRETLFSDQTVQFPTRSLSGNRHIMVAVDIDSSGILVEPIKNRSDNELTRAYRQIMRRLHRANIYPKKHVLDNEISAAMKTLIKDEFKMQLELVLSGCHRRNAAEVAIRIFKAHFLSILDGVADDFPANLWDRLLPQAEITINLLRQSNATPTISAYAHLNGPFDYNKMPLAPMGVKVQVHEKTDKRGTWAYHTVDGCYLLTSADHYRTHCCHVRDTRSDRLSDTVHFHHKNITSPSLTPTDKLMQAIADCAAALKGLGAGVATTQAQDLRRLLNATTTNLRQRDGDTHEGHQRSPLRPAPPLSPAPRVDEQPQHRYATRSTTRASAPSSLSQAAPRVRDTSTPRVPAARPTPPAPERRRRRPTQRVAANAPAMNTRARASAAGPPAANTRFRAKSTASLPTTNEGKPKPRRSRIPPPSSRRPTRRSSRIERLENEVNRALAVMDRSTGKLLKYRQLIRHPDFCHDWTISSANEFGRLANGVGGHVKGTNTITFVCREDIPKDRRQDVTCGQFQPNRFVVGGNRINYPGEVATPTADMLVAKILLNSVVSTPGARFMTMDISNFYLMTPLKRPEYIRMRMSDIPDEIICEYKLRDFASDDGSIYIAAVRGMYGLPHAGLLANELLEKRLNAHGYRQSKLVPGLWTHDWRPIQFTLVVDDFGVKYCGEEHTRHLLNVLQANYNVTADWSGQRYISISLDWDYANRKVHLSMPGYVRKALKQFGRAAPNSPQHSPFPCALIKYGATKQYPKERSTAPLLDKKGKKFIQQVCGKLLCLGRAVDPTLLCPISAIASQSAKPTTDTLKQTYQFLDYLASQEEAVITYNASGMVLATHSDASYLSEPKARSRAGGHFFLSNNADLPANNGAILNIAHIIKHVMASATKAELAALYIMAREAVYIRIILEELGHKQPPTPLQTDNSMAEGVVNGKVQPKRTKAMDMRFHWLRDRECQEQFRIYWRPGRMNYADYWTKHHPDKHHQQMQKEFLTPYIIVEMLRQKQANKIAAAAA